MSAAVPNEPQRVARDSATFLISGPSTRIFRAHTKYSNPTHLRYITNIDTDSESSTTPSKCRYVLALLHDFPVVSACDFGFRPLRENSSGGRPRGLQKSTSWQPEANQCDYQQSHKTFKIKQKLAKAQKQNRPIPQWIRLRTGNTIRYDFSFDERLTYLCRNIQIILPDTQANNMILTSFSPTGTTPSVGIGARPASASRCPPTSFLIRPQRSDLDPPHGHCCSLPPAPVTPYIPVNSDGVVSLTCPPTKRITLFRGIEMEP